MKNNFEAIGPLTPDETEKVRELVDKTDSKLLLDIIIEDGRKRMGAPDTLSKIEVARMMDKGFSDMTPEEQAGIKPFPPVEKQENKQPPQKAAQDEQKTANIQAYEERMTDLRDRAHKGDLEAMKELLRKQNQPENRKLREFVDDFRERSFVSKSIENKFPQKAAEDEQKAKVEAEKDAKVKAFEEDKAKREAEEAEARKNASKSKPIPPPVIKDTVDEPDAMSPEEERKERERLDKIMKDILDDRKAVAEAEKNGKLSKAEIAKTIGIVDPAKIEAINPDKFSKVPAEWIKDAGKAIKTGALRIPLRNGESKTEWIKKVLPDLGYKFNTERDVAAGVVIIKEITPL